MGTALIVVLLGCVVLSIETNLVVALGAGMVAVCVGRVEQAVTVRGSRGVVFRLLDLGLYDMCRFCDPPTCREGHPLASVALG